MRARILGAMGSFENTLPAVNDLKGTGIIDDYAVAGAMALMFWIEPVSTFDLDVLVLLPQSAGPLILPRTDLPMGGGSRL